MAKRRGKRKRSYSRKRRYTKRKPGMGLLGKAGIAMAAGTPFLVAGAAAFGEVQQMNGLTKKAATFGSQILYFIFAFFNALIEGLGFDRPFRTMEVHMKDGSIRNTGFTQSVPKGSMIPIIEVGGFMAIADVALLKILGKNVKEPLTGRNII